MKLSYHHLARDRMKYENPDTTGIAIQYAWHMSAQILCINVFIFQLLKLYVIPQRVVLFLLFYLQIFLIQQF